MLSLVGPCRFVMLEFLTCGRENVRKTKIYWSWAEAKQRVINIILPRCYRYIFTCLCVFTTSLISSLHIPVLSCSEAFLRIRKKKKKKTFPCTQNSTSEKRSTMRVSDVAMNWCEHFSDDGDKLQLFVKEAKKKAKWNFTIASDEWQISNRWRTTYKNWLFDTSMMTPTTLIITS